MQNWKCNSSMLFDGTDWIFFLRIGWIFSASRFFLRRLDTWYITISLNLFAYCSSLHLLCLRTQYFWLLCVSAQFLCFQGFATFASFLAASLIGFEPFNERDLACVQENPYCSYTRELCRTFTLNAIAFFLSCACLLCATTGLLFSVFTKKMRTLIQVVDIICLVFEFMSCILQPLVVQNVFGIPFSRFVRTSGTAFWDSSLFSLILFAVSCFFSCFYLSTDPSHTLLPWVNHNHRTSFTLTETFFSRRIEHKSAMDGECVYVKWWCIVIFFLPFTSMKLFSLHWRGVFIVLTAN